VRGQASLSLPGEASFEEDAMTGTEVDRESASYAEGMRAGKRAESERSDRVLLEALAESERLREESERERDDLLAYYEFVRYTLTDQTVPVQIEHLIARIEARRSK
jgi:hypothetical protein